MSNALRIAAPSMAAIVLVGVAIIFIIVMHTNKWKWED